MILPARLAKGRQSTIAVDRLILVDPRGEIDEKDLLEFLERYIEPDFWPWFRKKQKMVEQLGQRTQKQLEKEP